MGAGSVVQAGIELQGRGTGLRPRLIGQIQKLMFRLGAAVEDGRSGWIPLVFLFAWMQARIRPGDAIQGAGPELLHEMVKRLAAG